MDLTCLKQFINIDHPENDYMTNEMRLAPRVDVIIVTCFDQYSYLVIQDVNENEELIKIQRPLGLGDHAICPCLMPNSQLFIIHSGRYRIREYHADCYMTVLSKLMTDTSIYELQNHFKRTHLDDNITTEKMQKIETNKI